MFWIAKYNVAYVINYIILESCKYMVYANTSYEFSIINNKDCEVVIIS